MEDSVKIVWSPWQTVFVVKIGTGKGLTVTVAYSEKRAEQTPFWTSALNKVVVVKLRKDKEEVLLIILWVIY